MTYDYSAKTSYNKKDVAEKYEEERFSGLLGRYRHYREQKAIARIVGSLPNRITVLDCPCGTGRWWPVLAQRAERIIAMDVADAMLESARRRAEGFVVPVSVSKGDAECLDLEDGSVDYVFCHALTKHLPIPVQHKVLRELARVARAGVVCSFGIFGHVSYEFWRRRRLVESYPVTLEQLLFMAAEAGLKMRRRMPCTTPIGVEYSVLFEKA